jgi:hypothetical protein
MLYILLYILLSIILSAWGSAKMIEVSKIRSINDRTAKLSDKDLPTLSANEQQELVSSLKKEKQN